MSKHSTHMDGHSSCGAESFGDAGSKESSTPGKVPSREERVRAAKETHEICRRGSYRKGGREVMLPGASAIRRVEYILDYPDEPLAKPPRTCGQSPRYVLTNQDAFAAAGAFLVDTASAAVHNFACASHPGGGFWSGSGAQEESLCRESTLYASISSPNAEMYYNRNRAWQGDFYPDDMLWSPYVLVIRDAQLNLLEKPFPVSVFTLAAPNLKGRAKHAPQTETDRHMERRLVNMLDAARQRGIRSLVLGAWGCGAFRHEPSWVAELMRKVLVGDGWDRCFENIVFAIRGEADSANMSAFRTAFAAELES